MGNAPHDVNGIEIRPGDRVSIASSIRPPFGDPIEATVKVLESSLTVLVEVPGMLGGPVSVSASRVTILDPEVRR